MMKKILLASACVLTLTLTSCFENAGFTQSSNFARVVTVNRNANPLQLDADYTGEVFKPENLTMPEQLSQFGLENADRAVAYIHYEIEDYKSSLTLNGAAPIKIFSVWNKALPVNEKIKPLTDLYRMQLDNSFSYPLTWMSGRYLNIAPVIKSDDSGSYYLMPKAVIGDTLRFDMAAEFTESAEKDVADFVNFDLTTLADTLDSDEATLPTVRKMLNAIEAKDSVCVLVVFDYKTTGYLGTDTIIKMPVNAGYSSQLRTLLKQN